MEKNYSLITDRAERDREILRDFKAAAKVADQKLRRLEKLATQDNFKAATRYAYAQAMEDIKAAGGNKRFDFKLARNADGSINMTAFKMRMADIERWMSASTSSKTGILSSYNSKTQTTKERYGLDVKWEDMANFYESKLWKDAAQKFGSKTAAKILGKIKEKGDSYTKLLKESQSKHKTIPALLDSIKKRPRVFDQDLNELTNMSEMANTSPLLDDQINKFISSHKSQLLKIL